MTGGALLFLLCGFFAVLSGVMVVFGKDAVRGALFLILAFASVAGVFLSLGAEFLAMILVVTYVGAVATLFVFVVMMLDWDDEVTRRRALGHVPAGLCVTLALGLEVLGALYVRVPETIGRAPFLEGESDVQGLGMILYTDYFLAFQLLGLTLLATMAGAIVLTLRRREGVRRQDATTQILRRREDAVRLTKPGLWEGADPSTGVHEKGGGGS